MVHVLAVDLGASGGRVLRDLPAGETVACLGFDTWGVDFGLLDGQGRLMSNPVHYRDRRTEGQAAAVAARWDEGALFRRTRIQDAWFSTVYLLTGALARDPAALVPSHDTEAAALAVPIPASEPFAFLSCGTWSVLGAELLAPVLSEEARLGGTSCLLRNIMGLWLIQESRRWWERSLGPLPWEVLIAEAEAAPAWAGAIDVTDEVFAASGDLPGRVADWCRRTDQSVPETRGALLRCLHESLACGFRRSLEQLEALTGLRFATLWMVGGGTKNRLLGRLTAQVTGRPVTAGPAETTALGVFADAAEARRAVAESFGTETRAADTEPAAQAYYRRWKELVGGLG